MKLNRYIDHTLLKPTATKDDIIQLCKEAIQYDFFSVCVNSCYVSLAKTELKKSNVKVCSVVGFPLGAMSTQAKVFEAEQALRDGANEIDMVINIGIFKSKDYDAVIHDINAIKNVMPSNVLKVILETSYLDDEEIIKASELTIKAGADYIKTSTGFGSGGATIHAVKLMKSVADNCKVKIKASGGIRDYKTAMEFINLGVERLGVSSGIAIINGEQSESDY
ncbi:MAG: deoxyribose-phosphate aldolase [Flavobacteriaceae bacterium]